MNDMDEHINKSTTYVKYLRKLLNIYAMKHKLHREITQKFKIHPKNHVTSSFTSHWKSEGTIPCWSKDVAQDLRDDMHPNGFDWREVCHPLLPPLGAGVKKQEGRHI